MTRKSGDGKNRRAAPRVKVAQLVGYADKRGDKIYNLLGSAVTVDLSETGVRLQTREPLPIAATLELEIKLGGEVHTTQGRIIWGEELDEGASYEFGVRFVDVPERLKETLRVFVSLKRSPEED